ncbi:YkyA family protein [Anaerobacillus sp. MEB173]|uniref:YkyA family protein n=1 Tax=Anaerobacillus sp. MEB173 TaxID=3383345 RepID=UPI003F8EB97A
MIHRYFFIFGIWLLIVIILSGCSASPVQKIYDHLEQSAEIESLVEEHQEPLMNFETQEHQLFEEMIVLSLADIDKIQTLAEEAIELATKREETIEEERERLEQAFEEFNHVEELISGIEDEETREIAAAMYETMEHRYESYKRLYDSYTNSVQLDKQLYEMLQDEELKINDLENQINTINEAYKDVFQKEDEFNTFTKEYNEHKKQFYEAAALNVSFE